MRPSLDAAVVQGCLTKYACGSVADVDKHLRGLRAWFRSDVAKMNDRQRRTAAVRYRDDVDLLLHARAMLAALDTLDEDLADLEVGILRERDTTIYR